MSDLIRPSKITDLLSVVAKKLNLPLDVVSDVSSFYFKDLIRDEINNAEDTLILRLSGLGSYEFYRKKEGKGDKVKIFNLTENLEKLQKSIHEYENLVNSKTLDKTSEKRVRTLIDVFHKKCKLVTKKLENYKKLCVIDEEYKEKVKQFRAYNK